MTSNRSHLAQRKFSVRRIIEANSRSRAASQGGSRWATGRNDLDAATGDPQSTPDSRARSHASADCLRIIRALCRCRFTDCPSPRLVANMGYSWTVHVRGLNMIADCSRTWTICVRSLCATGRHTRLRTGCGQFVSLAVDTSWTRPFAQTVSGRGLFADPAESCPSAACSQFAFAD